MSALHSISLTFTLSADPLWELSFRFVSQYLLECMSSVDLESVPKRRGALYVYDFELLWIKLTKNAYEVPSTFVPGPAEVRDCSTVSLLITRRNVASNNH